MNLRFTPGRVLLVLAALGLSSAMLVVFAALITYPKLPSLEVLTDYRPKLPLRIYSADGKLIGEFGEERRSVVRITDVPQTLIDAILAAEDERFYQHGGIDYTGVLRATLVNFISGETRQGASTITMQVAKNFFLSSEKTFTRKFNEALLSYKIESNLSKDQILELYINQIYLGQRSYGFAAAARTYFGKELKQLSIAETAMLAGLPKAPSTGNPISNPQRARGRMLYVLDRMHELGRIDAAQLQQARDESLRVRRSRALAEGADFVAEMVRRDIFERYGEAAYNSGIAVHTTILSKHQAAAEEALRRGVLDYEARRGYRGPVRQTDLPTDDDSAVAAIDEALADLFPAGGLQPAVVLAVGAKELQARTRSGEVVTLGADSIAFGQRFLDPKTEAKKRLRRGTVVWLRPNGSNGWALSQMPDVEGALVAIEPGDGAIRALVGGFDASRNQFNHVTQAWRQPGSAFKPFIYSAALEKGFGPASVIDDSPIYFDRSATGSDAWAPQNYDGVFDGPMRLRPALAKSKNMVAIRVLQSITPLYAQEYITRFGFDAERHPPYLTMALGAGSVTPLQLAEGYMVLANGGYRVRPHLITRVVDNAGRVLAQTRPTRAGGGAPQVIEARNAYLMTSLLQDVVRSGTATRALTLGRSDLAGKTGTTNKLVDAWFAGYSPRLVAVSWIGFDQPRSLGGRETGGSAALPIWIDYMRTALKDYPEASMPRPDGVVEVRVNPITGKPAENGISELFFDEYAPPPAAPTPPWGVPSIVPAVPTGEGLRP